MIAFFCAVAVAILGFTHYLAFAYGIRWHDRRVFWRFYRPLLKRHERLARAFSEAALDDNATAQQKNLKLVGQNAFLRGKAIHYASRCRKALSWSRRKGMLHTLSLLATTMKEVEKLDSLRK